MVVVARATANVTGWFTLTAAQVEEVTVQVIVTEGPVRTVIAAVPDFDPAAAVTVLARSVVRVVRASPLALVFTTDADSVPLSVVKVTGMPTSVRPPVPVAVATISTLPPVLLTEACSARTVSVSMAAAPMLMLRTFDAVEPAAAPEVAPAAPEVARTSATPLDEPAVKVALARPPVVCTVVGAMVPSVVVKVTCVPFCTGVPLPSSTNAVTSVVPPVDSVRVAALNVTLDPVGAVSGTLSHERVRTARSRTNREACKRGIKEKYQARGLTGASPMARSRACADGTATCLSESDGSMGYNGQACRRRGPSRKRPNQEEATLLDHTVLIKAAHDLAPLPPAVVRLAALVGKGTYSADDVEAIVRLDAPLTLRLLQYANSAANAGHMPIGTVRDAVTRVGVGPLLSFATGSNLRPDLIRAIPAYGLSEGDLWRHSVAAALATEVIAQSVMVDVPADAFTVGLLHDIGKLTLARFLEPDHLRLLATAREEGGESSLRAEVEILGVHHGELGGLIASHWNLPSRIVRGITYHHAPSAGCDVICDVAHVANVLAKRAGTGHVAMASDLNPEPESLERLGLAAGRLAKLEEKVKGRLDEAVARFG